MDRALLGRSFQKIAVSGIKKSQMKNIDIKLGGGVSLKERLDEFRNEYGFSWIEVVNAEGLSLCEAGSEELPELAARLPDFINTGDEIAKAAKLGHGMRFMLLIPKKGAYALLMRSFEVRQESFVLVVGTAKLPSKPSMVLEEICTDVSRFL